MNFTNYFLQIIKATNSQGILASPDVEALYTNLPVATFMNILCDCVYNHATLPPPPFARTRLKKLLPACMTESPFTHIDGQSTFNVMK